MGNRATKTVAVLVFTMGVQSWAAADPLSRLRFMGSKSWPIQETAYKTTAQTDLPEPVLQKRQPNPRKKLGDAVDVIKSKRPKRSRGAKRKRIAKVASNKRGQSSQVTQPEPPKLLGLFATTRRPGWARKVFRSD